MDIQQESAPGTSFAREDIVQLKSARRRAALISLSNLSDDRMRYAKSGEWWNTDGQRRLANNSVAYTEKPEMGSFMREWQALYDSKSGERGIFNREAAKKYCAATGRDPNHEFLTNPCCLTGDMQLLTVDGYKRFDELAQQETVELHTVGGGRSTGAVWPTGVKPVVSVTFNDSNTVIKATEDHVFMTPGGFSCEARDLVGESVVTQLGRPLVVAAVTPAGEEEVFDFMEPTHNWGFVNGVVVHNCEIILRPQQFCNLTSIVVRPEDTMDDLRDKAEIASILGTLQATATNFVYLSKKWKQNCEDERLLGVSMTGPKDHPVLQNVSDEAALWLKDLSKHVVDTNKEYAKILNIKPAAAAVCQKPEGCRPGTALTTTDKGILTLDELLVDHQPGARWGAPTEDYLALGPDAMITRTFDNGLAPIYSIDMTYGVSLRSTANHQWFVSGRRDGTKTVPVGGWVRADAIKPGDIIDNTPGIYRKPEHTLLVQQAGMPNAMNEDLAWLIGYLWGDGSMSPTKYRLRFIDQKKANLRKVRRIFAEQFGKTVKIHKCKNKDAHTLELGSRAIWDWFLANGIWKYNAQTEEKLAFIPHVVRTSAWQDIVAFISGNFDADGCHSGTNQVLSTSYAKYADHIQHVAWSVGLLFGRAHNTRGKNFQKKKNMWLMNLSSGTLRSAFEVFVSNSTKLTGINVDEQRALKENHLVLGQVKGVTLTQAEATFDVETEAHWFMAGAFKSHNTSSQLTDTASGGGKRFAPFYFRRVRADGKDPLAIVMQEQGFPCEDDVMQPSDKVFTFPIKAPEGSATADVPALEQLAYWRQTKLHWCDSHNPSVTIYVKEHEWFEVGAWVYNHFDDICGLSFLPHSDHIYQQAPYEACTEEEYEELLARMPSSINHEALAKLETTDHTTGMQEYACVGGSCEI